MDPSRPEVLAESTSFRFLREWTAEGAGYTLGGDVDAAAAEKIFQVLEEESGEGASAELLLEEAEVTDGPATARMVDAVRLLLARFSRLRLVRPPQALAHSLYRVGMLRPGSRIELVEPREEEGRAN